MSTANFFPRQVGIFQGFSEERLQKFVNSACLASFEAFRYGVLDKSMVRVGISGDLELPLRRRAGVHKYRLLPGHAH